MLSDVNDTRDGSNLLFYGFGSKKKALELFAKTMLKKYPYIVVNGFFPGLTIKEVRQYSLPLQDLTSLILMT
jgi:origin recognition complex subunit 2